MYVLFVENNDSFSWNVVDALPFARSALRIVRGADVDALAGARAVVVGPGPLDPERAGLVEFVRAAAQTGVPTLGICLGHQAIGMAFGARVARGEPVHGRTSRVRFSGSRWFDAFGETDVMRYHSLAVTHVEAPLRVTATSAEGVVMAIEHERLPVAGLQFHPDSYATPRGRELVAAFFREVS